MRSSFNKTFLIVLLGALIILVSLQFVPKTPKQTEAEISVKRAEYFVNNGKVMEGIRLLKDVLKKDENNLDALWTLGKFSMQSNQFGKAITRFEKFSKLAEGEDKVSGYIYLSDAYFYSGDIQKSLDAIVSAKSLTKNEKMISEIELRFIRIKNINLSIEK